MEQNESPGQLEHLEHLEYFEQNLEIEPSEMSGMYGFSGESRLSELLELSNTAQLSSEYVGDQKDSENYLAHPKHLGSRENKEIKGIREIQESRETQQPSWRQSLVVGSMLDAQDYTGRWLPAQIRHIDIVGPQDVFFKIHFLHYSSHFDERFHLSSDKIAHFQSKSKVVPMIAERFKFQTHHPTVSLGPSNGRVGLFNLGNSCFMNAVLQCLFHLQPLFQYFTSNTYQDHLNVTNILGYKGDIAMSFSLLCQKYWNSSLTSIAPQHFRQMLSRFQPQFGSQQQQDCAHFLGFLLDALHEDLNQIKEPPPYRTIDSDIYSMPQLFEEYLKYHQERNKSMLSKSSQGHIQSHVQCLECNYASIKFEPYFMLSLEIPQTSTNFSIFPNFRFHLEYLYNQSDLSDLTDHKDSINKDFPVIFVDVMLEDTVLSFKQKLVQLYSRIVSTELLKVVLEGSSNDFCEDHVSIRSLLTLAQRNLTAQSHVTQEGQENKTNRINQVDAQKESNQESNTQCAKEVTESNQDNTSDKQNNNINSVNIMNPLNLIHKPILTVNVLKCDVEGNVINPIFRCELMRNANPPITSSFELHDCLAHFIELEELHSDNLWYCSKCKTKQKSHKQLHIWTIPDILFIHFKRFECISYNHIRKLSHLVKFPLENLDMNHFLSRNLNRNTASLYNCRGIINHVGSIQTGHYSAYIKNRHDSIWYEYNDNRVTPLRCDENLVSHHAYILVYEKHS